MNESERWYTRALRLQEHADQVLMSAPEQGPERKCAGERAERILERAVQCIKRGDAI